MNRVYRLSFKAIKEEMSWDEALYEGEIVTVKEFDTYEEAVKYFESCQFDSDLYGAE